MAVEARLNLLLTPPPRQALRPGAAPWHQTLSQLLVPLGVRTFEANSGPEAVDLIEKHPIHLAVVDWRLPMIGGLDVLRLVQMLHRQHQAAAQPPGPPTGAPASFQFQVNVEEKPGAPGQRRIEVRFDAHPADTRPGPVVILIAPPAPQQDPQMLQEALKFNAFSVLSEPVDVNLMLEVMARAMKRFHQNLWPS